jgi:transcriptional regulator with XRE-family HTH domain
MQINFGKTLKQLRVTRGLTQSELGAQIGSTQAYISMLESQARGNISLDLLKAIATALAVPISELLV